MTTGRPGSFSSLRLGGAACAAGAGCDGAAGFTIGAATAPGATRIGGVFSREPEGREMNGACGDASARPPCRMGSGGGAPTASRRGARSTRPVSLTTGRIGTAARAPCGDRVTSCADADGVIGAPRFSRIALSFSAKTGGAGGGARRAATGRSTTRSGGLAAARAGDGRIDWVVGRIGNAPLITGCCATCRTTLLSRTMAACAGCALTKASRLTTVAYVRFTYVTFVTFVTETCGRAPAPHHGTRGSRGPRGNQPTNPPPPTEIDADQPGPPPTNATIAGA